MAGRLPRIWTEQRVLDTLEGIAALNPRVGGGLAVFIDEMGKFLEASAHDGSDIHLFQQLAERAARSRGRLLVVGILHQAFEEYAHRLSRQMRDEWSKIQGRFVDLGVNTAGEEQIDLLGRAIESDHPAKPPGSLAKGAAQLIHGKRSPHLAEMLEDCWPLHPVAACLLGPLSRRRFGQNQRSIFGFLNSAEPQGFQDFLRNATRRRTLRAGSVVGLPADQPGAFHPGLPRWPSLGASRRCAGPVRGPGVRGPASASAQGHRAVGLAQGTAPVWWRVLTC